MSQKGRPDMICEFTFYSRIGTNMICTLVDMELHINLHIHTFLDQRS